jgi:hypothetical protein
MSKKNEEYVDHLFLYCEVTCAIWNVYFKCFGLSWVIPKLEVNLFAFWWIANSSWSAAVWKMVHLCLWREMNYRCFDECERTLEELQSCFFNTLYLWTAAYIFPLVISFYDFFVLFAPTN